MHRTRARILRPLVLLITIIATAVGASLSSAQQAPGRVFGTVVDQRGRSVAKVPVVLTRKASGKHYKARSDATGKYSLDGIPSGDYEAECKREGFLPATASFTVPPGGGAEWHAELDVAWIFEEVYVPFDSAEAAIGPESGPEAADPCTRSDAGGCVRPPLKFRHTYMAYPRRQREQKRTGVVEVEAVLDTDGRLGAFKVVRSDDEDFASAAISTMSEWRYHPARLDGAPVEMKAKALFHFGATRQ